ncbi:hypothetical protein DFJ58DRAFT_909624 [Suillus subalutaceus]|uniref:uncharacterized protein n=1 Tax=Suillus subalutaceus TaxID=48586 RepID=UPI001B8833D8|nr:uncharacterized protein DFJ58DRAFT_909624 [Suillus subalutaceus]KAG1877992.1 hypothetical protein DFJ58DRAFT_909624 [Suillus subalutaceus]
MMPPPQAKAWSLVVILEAALVPRGAFAQMSTVTCLSSFGWMNNSLGQDPCFVAAYLQSACEATTIDPLPPGYIYAAPSAALANPCVCSTVTYSMLSACADCQNATYLKYPINIPTGIKVPNWAYLSVSGASGFDPVAAQSNGDLPESTATSGPTITVTYSTTISASLTSVSASLTSSLGAATGSSTTSSTNSKSSNVGAIAGGVVGGIAGVAAIIGLVTWYFVKRRPSSTTPSAAFNDIGGGPGHTQSFYSTNTTTFPMAQQSRLYDPSDPTTFPGRPHSFTGPVATSSNVHLNPSMPSPVFSRQSHPGQYAGIPQV